MLSASDFILALLKIAREEGDVKVTPLKIQKIFFFLKKEGGVKLGLDFQPYLFGPYSQIYCTKWQSRDSSKSVMTK